MNYHIVDSATEQDDEDIHSTSTGTTSVQALAAESDTNVWGIPVAYWGSGRADYNVTSGYKCKWFHEENGKASKNLNYVQALTLI